MKPIKIWVSSSGPNPWKPVIILEELGLTYTIEKLTFDRLIGAEFRKINPVGKVPALFDPNTDVLIWESGAIILYLIEQYDKQHKLEYTSVNEKALLYQWLMYQMSQQGPYYGQGAWFSVLHSEKLPSAIDRYEKQVNIVLKVLDDALDGRDWLVGEKCTYADLSFFMWNEILPLTMPGRECPMPKFANVQRWHNTMKQMPAVSKVLRMRQDAMDSEGLPEDATPKSGDWSQAMEDLDAAATRHLNN